MSYQTKRKILNSTVYIVLGLVIAAVIAVTVVTVVGMHSEKNPPEISSGESKTPDVTNVGIFDDPKSSPADKEETPAPVSDGRADKTPDGTPDNTNVLEPVSPVICLPANGSMLKGYSAELPVYSLTMNDYRTHAGVDISAPVGSAVAAMCDGTVMDVWSDPMMGMCLRIDHGNGLMSIYKNLDAIFPSEIVKGASVKAGQIVGSVGNTSLIELADADHLHFEVTLNGKHVDPGGYVDFSALAKTDSGND